MNVKDKWVGEKRTRKNGGGNYLLRNLPPLLNQSSTSSTQVRKNVQLRFEKPIGEDTVLGGVGTSAEMELV